MRCGATVLALIFLLPCNHRGEDVVLSEYQVKAAFVFNFVKFIEWPVAAFADARSPIAIGILGKNLLGEHLNQLVRDKTLNNRSIVIRECKTLEEARTCHVIFINVSETKRVPEILQRIGTDNILTVGETEDFIKNGGMINFFREGNRFRFQINDEPAKKAGLKIDSKLLGLSKKHVT